MNLTTATPVEIDTEIARLMDEAQEPAAIATRAADAIFTYAGMRRATDKVSRYDTPKVVGTLDEAIAKVESGEVIERYYVETARRQVETLRTAREALAANREEQAPLHAEYDRRGGWTRAFLVITSGKGHVHSSRSCSTCYPTTQYGWLPQVSGFDEAEIVAAAGADACTVCYPTAPVATAGARTLLHRTEVEAQAARDERAAAKAERDAKRAAKALVLNLSEQGVTGYTGRIETITGAKAYLTDSFSWNRDGREHPSYPAAAVARVAQALADKMGTSPEVEMAAAEKRAAKRR